MVLTWVDFLVVLVIIGFVLFEVRRDFGQTLIDTVALLLSMRAAVWLCPSAARTVPLAVAETLNRGVWLIVAFVLCSAVGLLLARFAHESTRWTLETFDPVFGFVFGMTSAVIISHVLMKSLAMIYATKAGLPPCIAQSALGEELLTFRSYHHLMQFLSQFPNHRA
jgi:uncharacterized membrane protein required for colicin V production